MAETKQQPSAISQTVPARPTIVWPIALTTLGRLLNSGAVGGLIVLTYYSLYKPAQYPMTPAQYHDWFNPYGVMLAAITIFGFILCTTSLCFHRISQRPAAVLFRGKVGLALGSLALLAVVADYLFG